MRRGLLRVGTALAGLMAAALPAHGQGSAVMVHGSCATAMGAAGVADPCEDGSAVLFNPAALAMQPSVVGVGWTGITASGAFTYDFTGERIERGESTSSVPFAYLNYRFNDRVALALGAFAPYGLGLDWPACPVADPRCGGTDFEGRFVSYDTSMRSIYIQPTIAYQALDWVSVGAGVDYVRGSIDIHQRVDLATTPLPAALAPFPGATFGNFGVASGTDFADVGLSGEGSGLGFHFGALARFTERFSLGVRYLSAVEIDYEGDADFTQIVTNAALPNGVQLDPLLTAQFQDGAPLADQGLTTRLTLPAQAVVGAAIRPVPALLLLADYQWTGWSSFDEAPIDFQSDAAADQTLVLDYRDTDTYRLGAQFDTNEALTLRAGFIYNTAAQEEFSVSPLLAEAERNYYTLGLGYRFTDVLRVDAGYQLVDQSDRRGRVRGRAPGLTDAQLQALNVGVYESEVNVFNVTLSYHFGGR